jgi:uncharacterized protein YlxP (DUF503 family)
MRVALLRLEMHFFETRSLKDKRSALARLRAELRKRFNVSVAELDHQDLWQRATFGLAFFTPHADSARAEEEKILKFLESRLPGEIVEHTLELC